MRAARPQPRSRPLSSPADDRVPREQQCTSRNSRPTQAIRLRRDDFDDPHELAEFAATVGLTLADFRGQFEYLIAHEPPPLEFVAAASR